MDYDEYQKRVLDRASHRWHNERVPLHDFRKILENFIIWGNKLDAIKKGLMYDREPEPGTFSHQHPLSTVPTIPERDQRIFHAMIGVATEGVEMMEAAFEHFFGGVHFDRVNLQEEFGDVEWYRAFGLSELRQTHEENIEQNDRKLELRYKGRQFTEQAANERDLDAERKANYRSTTAS
jgi:hypothetical protein